MKKVLLLLSLIVCITAKAQDKVLSIPYSSNKSIYGIISEPSSNQKKHGIAIICHGFNPEERAKSNQYVEEFLKPQKTLAQ